MSADLKDAMTILGLLERGSLAPGLSAELDATLKALQTVAGEAGKAKGNLTLKLTIEVELQQVRIRPEITTKLPKLPRAESLFFVGRDGGLSLEHPQQISMFPHEVPAPRQGAAGGTDAG